MSPHSDLDLAALALRRGLVSPAQLRRALEEAPAHPRGLAGALVARGVLPVEAVRGLLAALARFPSRCAACGEGLLALPGPQPRQVPCPGCGRPVEVAGRPDGVPPLGPEWIAGGAATRGQGTAGAPRGSAFGNARPGTGTGGGAATHAADSDLVRRSPTPRRRLEPGDLAGPYRIEEQISRGAMGVVYRARHVDLPERAVALKIIDPDQELDAEALARFEREGESLARVDHPNVVRVHGAGHLSDGRPYLVMDYLPGQTLEHLLRGSGPQEEERAATIIAQVARAAQALHERGILHRDLKLGNVMFDEEGRPRVADFGLVRLTGRQTRLTRTGDLLGTPLYMAPEMIRGDAEPDARVDVYAIGVMLFRMLTGAYPFRAESQSDLFRVVLQAPLEFPAEHRLSSGIRAILERALARDRQSRYPDAASLATDLEALARGGAVQLPSALSRLWRRQRGLALGLLSLVVALVLGVGSWVVARGRRQAELLLAWERRLEACEAGAAALAEGRPLPAQATLAAGETGAEEEVPAALRARLEAARARLAAERARAEALRGLEGDAGWGGPSGLRERLRALLAAPPPPPESAAAGHLAFAWERGRALYLLGRLGEARDALASLASGPIAAAEDWLSQPAGRARWLRSWCRLRLGEVGDDDLAGAPAALRAELELAAALVAEPAPPERLQALAALPSGGDPAAALLGLRARLALRRARGAAPDREELAAARALSLPPRPGAVPAEVMARAALVEAELLLELGWRTSAEEACGRALQGLGPGDPPAWPIRLGQRPALLSPSCAALLLRTRAALERPGAREVPALAEAALERAGDEGPAARAEAELLQAEAWDQAGEAARADDALARARELAPTRDISPLLARFERRRGGARGRASPPGPEEVALLARVSAELAAWREPHRQGEERQGDPSHLEAARRAFLLALGLDPTQAAGAWAGLAEVACERQDLEGARRALERARAARPTSWEVDRAEGRYQARTGALAEAEAAFARGEAGLLVSLEGAGLLVRASARLGYLLDAADALALAQDRPAAARLLTRALEIAREQHLGYALQQSLWKLADSLQSRDEGQEARTQRQAVLQAINREAEAQAARLKEMKDQGPAKQVPESSWLATIDAERTSSSYYLNFYAWHSDLGSQFDRLIDGRAFDLLILAGELDAEDVITYMQIQRRQDAADPMARDLSVQAVPTLIGSRGRETRLAVRADEDLRLALAGIYALDLDIQLPEEDVQRALEGARRFFVRAPAQRGAPLVLGRLLLEVGDWAGAEELLVLSDALGLAFRRLRPDDGAISAFYQAMIAGWFRRWDDAARLLDQTVRAAEALRDRQTEVKTVTWAAALGLRVRCSPAFFEDRALPGTLQPGLVRAAERLAALGPKRG